MLGPSPSNSGLAPAADGVIGRPWPAHAPAGAIHPQGCATQTRAMRWGKICRPPPGKHEHRQRSGVPRRPLGHHPAAFKAAGPPGTSLIALRNSLRNAVSRRLFFFSFSSSETWLSTRGTVRRARPEHAAWGVGARGRHACVTAPPCFPRSGRGRTSRGPGWVADALSWALSWPAADFRAGAISGRGLPKPGSRSEGPGLCALVHAYMYRVPAGCRWPLFRRPPPHSFRPSPGVTWGTR